MINLKRIKNFLWITDDTDNARLQAILDSVNQMVINCILEYDFWEKIILVDINTIKGNFLPLRHINPSRIVSINDIKLNSEAWKDYLILENSFNSATS